MAFVKQQRRQIGGHHMYKSGKKQPGSSMKWLTSIFYCVSLALVVHLMLSEGDPEPVRPNVNGKTTSAKQRLRPPSASSFDATYSKKLPSYRQPENSQHVAEMSAAEENYYKEEQQKRKFEEEMIRSQEESEDETEEKQESQEDGAEEDVGEGAEEFTEQESNSEKESDESGVIENMQGLKASVEDAMKNLRSAADAKMGPVSEQLRDDVEQYESQIGNTASAINKKFFATLDMSLKVEEMLFDVIVDTTITSFQEQVSLLLADSSEALDRLVADAEEQDMDVLEIDKRIMEYEGTRKVELEEEIETTIANGVRSGFAYSIPTISKETMTALFAKLGYPVTMTTDSYQRLILEKSPNNPTKSSFTAEEVEAAISAIGREGINLKGKDALDAVATEDEEDPEAEGRVDDGEADDKGSAPGENEAEAVDESIVTGAEPEFHQNVTLGGAGNNNTALEGGNDFNLDETDESEAVEVDTENSEANGSHNATGNSNSTQGGDHVDGNTKATTQKAAPKAQGVDEEGDDEGDDDATPGVDQATEDKEEGKDSEEEDNGAIDENKATEDSDAKEASDENDAAADKEKKEVDEGDDEGDDDAAPAETKATEENGTTTDESANENAAAVAF